jgi:hypothetical protein
VPVTVDRWLIPPGSPNERRPFSYPRRRRERNVSSTSPDSATAVAKENERLSRVVDHLDGREDHVRVGDVAARVAAVERDTTVSALDDTHRRCTYASLSRTHLPLLDALDLVDFDRPRGVVRRTPGGTVSDAEETPGTGQSSTGDPVETVSWELLYFGVTGVGLALAGASAWGVSVVGTVPDALVGSFVVFLCAVTSGLQLTTRGRTDVDA